ncbi:NAD-dependent epimerase/dehydratase family protein [Neobacillus bataviensis]|uniref:NAD-dependent epimerase/dehydratase family protein n=1 Tax=Neobacillus bataviensis TaxID=220685 RepID=UPI001CBF071B|nr:NAD(P)-dependent oxidoreductase [Neobacillus bataviensis]
MRVFITGAGGNLGRVLAPALADHGHEPVLMDYRHIDTPYEFVEGDVRDGEFIKMVTRDVDVIVHGAALHGIHLSKYKQDDFWNLNVTGTHNVYQAAVENQISKVLFCSTMGVYGGSIPHRKDAYVAVTEDLALKPRDIYGLSKQLGENMAEYYYRTQGIKTISLRLGMFVPEDFVPYGFRLLKGGVDDRDVAAAFILALENETICLDWFNIMSEVPFTVEDEKDLVSNPRKVIEKYYPGAGAVFEQRGIDFEKMLGVWGNTYWPIDKAKRELGYHPQYNFDGYLKALQEHNKDYYPYAGLPWWGV